METYNRSRVTYGILIIIVILAGVGSRRFPEFLPGIVSAYAGDTLWALMIFLWGGFLFKSWHRLKIGTIALIFCLLIETSQLYHSPWIDSIRKTRIGGLLLGFGFLWSDIICYFIGILIGIIIDRIVTSIIKE